MANHYNGAKYPQSLYQCQCPACRCQAVQLNKWVLRLDLNNCSDWRFLIFSGSRFHASCADTAKERSPKSVSVRTTTRSPRVDDRSPLLPLTADTGWQKVYNVLRCKTTLSLVDQQTEFVLYIICSTGNQWSRSHSTRLMWSNLFSPQMSRPALFITTCSLLSWYWGAPEGKLTVVDDLNV